MFARNRTNTPYFVTITDNYSRYGRIYLISYKSEALKCFVAYLYEVESKFGAKAENPMHRPGLKLLSDSSVNYVRRKEMFGNKLCLTLRNTSILQNEGI